MFDSSDSDLVAGERRTDLVRAAAHIVVKPKPNGRYSFNADIPAEVRPQFTRALMRVEAELMLHDADLIGAESGESRTPDQRRADALIALILRVNDQST